MSRDSATWFRVTGWFPNYFLIRTDCWVRSAKVVHPQRSGSFVRQVWMSLPDSLLGFLSRCARYLNPVLQGFMFFSCFFFFFSITSHNFYSLQRKQWDSPQKFKFIIIIFSRKKMKKKWKKYKKTLTLLKRQMRDRIIPREALLYYKASSFRNFINLMFCYI